jgi:guanylate kinase
MFLSKNESNPKININDLNKKDNNEILNQIKYLMNLVDNNQKNNSESKVINKLKERLFNRQTESKEIISKRINRAEMEFKEMNKFDFIVLNDVVERAVSEIEALIVKSDL